MVELTYRAADVSRFETRVPGPFCRHPVATATRI